MSAPEPYYQDEAVCIYHGDCREVLPFLPASDFLVTDPPYPNNEGHFVDAIGVARDVLASWRGHEAIVFWTELERPPVPLPLVAVHIWHRTNVNGRPYEPAYHFRRDGVKKRSCVVRTAAVFGGVGPGCSEYVGHPTQKNEGAMRQLMRLLPDGAVLDPFMGSGTTLVAAKRLGRKAIGIERERSYCELAVERLRQSALPLELPA
jgi:DNA modification methylase